MSLCERFHCLPSQLDAEDTEFLRLIDIYDRYRPREGVVDYEQ